MTKSGKSEYFRLNRGLSGTEKLFSLKLPSSNAPERNTPSKHKHNIESINPVYVCYYMVAVPSTTNCYSNLQDAVLFFRSLTEQLNPPQDKMYNNKQSTTTYDPPLDDNAGLYYIKPNPYCWSVYCPFQKPVYVTAPWSAALAFSICDTTGSF
jgi:hypothetical protein